MSTKVKQLMKSWRVWLVMILLVISIILISPAERSGVAIRAVEKASASELGGIIAQGPNTNPASRERITAIDGVSIDNVEDYYAALQDLEPNATVTITTSERIYKLVTQPLLNTTILPQLEQKNVTETIIDNATGEQALVNRTILVNKTESVVIGTKDLGLTVFDAPSSNLRLGLDFQGGSRVILQPEQPLEEAELEILLSNLKQRLNVFGLSDVVVRGASDLEQNQFIVVEIAGINEAEIQDLIARQGKFEAKIGQETVFRGGDIRDVCLSPSCAGLDPYQGCVGSAGDFVCRYRFSITLSPEAAQKQADVTRQLEIIGDTRENAYLSEPLDLHLDDELVDSLNIGADLRGQAISEVQISGSGEGQSVTIATNDALNSMKRMQSILKTGSLPVKLEVVRIESVSAFLGAEFFENAIRVAAFALLAVIVILILIYKRVVVALPIILTSLIEFILLLGVAVVIRWNIDLAAVAGIIAAIGTGVNDQVIITDEALKGEKRHTYSWKEKSRNAFFIIMGAYFTMLVAMLPLFAAGAGLLRGFAVTTIIGITVGVLVTRPAFAKVVEILLK